MSHKAHHGVLVIEQGDSGVQAGALALLRACPDDLQVVGEIRGASRFRLASPVPLLSVNKLRGRREALRLCSGWLRRQLTHVVDFEEVETTDDQPEWGATLGRPEHGRTAYVTSLEATLDPRLHVTREVGDDDASERLRCVVLSHKTDDAPPAGPEKTLALFGLRDGAGTLAQALDVFNRHAVNLTYIQSHADLAAPGQFNFYCELQGHRRAEATQAALAELRGCSVFLKVLGSYGARHVTVM